MAVRVPLFMEAALGETAGKMIYPFNAAGMSEIHQLAGHAYALSPNPRIEVSGSLGIPLPGATFTDTWWSAGAGTTDVTNYDDAAETPNVFKVTDTYNSLRLIYDIDTSPFSADANNTQFPLYLYSPAGPVGDDWVDAGFRTMSNQDFTETFVIPVLSQFHGGGQSLAKSGTYFMTTSATPANATVIGVAALNQEANPAAYAAGSIPETPSQNNTVTTYYIAKVDYSPTTSGLYESGANYDLPLYYDYGTESIKQHSPTTWAALLNPFLRYYLSGQVSETYKLSYNVDGSDGVTNGTLYQDTAITTAGSTYNTRFVNADDYRTQEFPTGTATAQGASMAFRIHRGPNEAITLLGTSGSPQTFTSDGPVSDGAGGWEARNGFKFTSTGNIERTTYTTFTGGTEVTHSTTEWCNITPGSTRYIRFTDDTSATMGGSARSPASGFSYTENSYEWKVTQSTSPMTTVTSIIITWNGSQVAAQYYTTPTEALAVTSISAGAFTYDRAGNASQSYSNITKYGLARSAAASVARVTANTGDALNTWHSLAADREFRWASQEADGSYGARFTQCKVEIASDAAGTDILATGYYNTAWHGGGDVQFSSMSASGTGGNGLAGSSSATFFFRANGTAEVTGSASGGIVNVSGSPQNWQLSGAAGDYEVNFNWTHSTGSGSLPDGGSTTSGPAAASWVSCDTNRTWQIYDGAVAEGTGYMSGTVSIRRTSDNTVLDTGNVSLSVNYSP